MYIVRNSIIEVNMAKRLRTTLSFSNKGKEIIERTEDITDEQDLDKLLEREFEQIRKKRLYNEGLMLKMNNSFYIDTYETKLSVVNRRKELTLISPVNRDYLRKQKYTDIHMRIIVIGVLSRAREGLDTKAPLYLYDSRFYDHEQTQIVSTKADFKK